MKGKIARCFAEACAYLEGCARKKGCGGKKKHPFHFAEQHRTEKSCTEAKKWEKR